MEDGTFYVYSRSVTNYRYTVSVVLTSESERDDLESFYDSTVNGNQKTFPLANARSPNSAKTTPGTIGSKPSQ